MATKKAKAKAAPKRKPTPRRSTQNSEVSVDRKDTPPRRKPKGKPRGKPFKKGESGNPGGRPVVLKEVRDLARSYTVPAIDALFQIAVAGENESARVSAANSILDRGWGKPSQDVSISAGEASEGDAREAAVTWVTMMLGKPRAITDGKGEA